MTSHLLDSCHETRVRLFDNPAGHPRSSRERVCLRCVASSSLVFAIDPWQLHAAELGLSEFQVVGVALHSPKCVERKEQGESF